MPTAIPPFWTRSRRNSTRGTPRNRRRLFPAKRRLAVTLTTAFRDESKAKAIALSRWILETPGAAVLLPTVARSTRDAVTKKDPQVLSLLYDMCDAPSQNWEAVASALGVMAEIHDLNSLPAAIERVMRVSLA